MRIHGHPASRTTSAIAGSPNPPDTSLTTLAPALSAAAATGARYVSTEVGTPAAVSSRSTGTTRNRSSSASTRCAPGRVDSPPTSMMSAPSARICTACPTAVSRSVYRPPSENESGVTLSTPMITIRSGFRGSAFIRLPRTRAPAPRRGGERLLRLSFSEDQAQRLGTGTRIRLQDAAHGRGHRGRSGFAHTTHRHTQMLRLHHDDDAARLQPRHDRIGDLRGEPLLHLRASRVQIDE